MSNLIESFEKAVVKLRRRRVSQFLFDRYSGEVQHGLFAGLKLDRRNSCSKGLLGLKIFWLYETVVVEAIEHRGPFDDLINIGACDGYFSLGLLKAGLVRRSICFETFEKRQQAIRRYAQSNGLSDQVVVMGEATERIGELVAKHNYEPANSLVICDIEGAEFKLLSESFMRQLDGATLVVELHDRLLDGTAERRTELINRLPSGYLHEVIEGKPASWNGIEDLETLSDNDRALVTSEGRKVRGEWLVAWPG